MFYSDIILAKKGPLAKVWLAAHWDRKITKAQVFETDLHQSIEAITGTQVGNLLCFLVVTGSEYFFLKF